MKLGLIGKKLGHSWSPVIHQELLGYRKVEGTYELIEISEEEVAGIPGRMAREEITGLNVTIPYKETLLGSLDEISREVKEIGALNTILYRDGKTYGYNTDYYGVLYMFEKAGISLKGKEATILGAGGAAKAAVYALRTAGASVVTVAARDKEKAEKALCGRFPGISVCGLEEIKGGDVLFNTTPVGMYPNAGSSVVGREVIRNFQAAADMVYNPLETEFLRLASEEGLKTVSGLSMLVGQAVKAQEIWFSGETAPEAGEKILEMLKERMRQGYGL